METEIMETNEKSIRRGNNGTFSARTRVKIWAIGAGVRYLHGEMTWRKEWGLGGGEDKG